MQCKRRETAGFDLSGRWRPWQGDGVECRLGQSLGSPHTRDPRHSPQTPLTRAKPTGRMIKNGGPQWLGFLMGANPLLVFGKNAASRRVSGSSTPPQAVRC